MLTMPTSKVRAPSALAARVLKQLEQLKLLRGFTFDEIKRRGGCTQQTWDNWTKGSPPGLDSLELTAKALDAELVVEVIDKRVERAPEHAQIGVKVETIEVAAYMDKLPQTVREQIRDTVYRLGKALHEVENHSPSPKPNKR